MDRSEQRWRGVVDHVPDQLVVIDAKGRIVYANEALDDLQFPEGSALREVLAEEGVHTLVGAVSADGRRRDFEVVVRSPSGQQRVLSGHAGPVEDGPGGGVVVMVLRDITQARALERRAASSEKMDAIGRLAGGIAHDFNNLLTAITSYAEFALEEGAPLEAREADIRGVLRTAERGAALARQLLMFSSSAPRRTEVIDVAALLEEVRGLLARTVGESVRVVVTVDGAGHHVEADPGQLERVLLNLGVHARESMPGGGTLRLHLDRARELDLRSLPGEDYVRLRVIDDGEGIAPDLQGRIFEPLFGAEGKSGQFALASSYGIVRQVGGELRLTSELGKGSEFTLFLPRTDRPVEKAAGGQRPENAAAAEGSTPRQRVLVAEDEPIVRDLVRRVLGRAGFELLVAVDGKEAMDLLDKTSAVDLILTDLVMPRVGGVALAAHAAKTHPNVPVLFMTGYASETDAPRGVRPEQLLSKPFNSAQLLRRVRAALAGAGEEAAPGPPTSAR